MFSIKQRFTNFSENDLFLLLVLFSLMIFLLVRQVWWRPIEREIKFLKKEVLINQSELKNFPVQKNYLNDQCLRKNLNPQQRFYKHFKNQSKIMKFRYLN